MTDIIQKCRVTRKEFIVDDKAQAFYAKIGVPLPSLCPEERNRRRLAWRNERSLYYRTCSATGQKMMSIHHQDKPFPVYENDYWWSDNWDPLEYGRDFDFSRPFFEQFFELQSVVPHCALNVIKPTMENSDYCNQTGYIKDCYLIFDSRFSERCMYSKSIENCYDCVDCYKVFGSELCYECDFCLNCYGCTYLFNSQNCSDCHYGSNLIGCKYCFGCTDLRNKEFYFMNEKCASREEWQAKVDDILHKLSRDTLLEHFSHFRIKQPAKWMEEINTENCTGDYLISCKDCTECYDSEDLENCHFCYDIKRTQDHSPSFSNYDISHFGGPITECYECCSIGNQGTNRLLFCDNVWSSNDIYYSRFCNTGSHDLFGCISLRHAEYCILNKQYTKEEYEELVPRIIEHMKSTGEWGEFFPMEHSPFEYHETLAQEFYPVDEATSPNKTATDQVPEGALICEDTGKAFRITPQERAFYTKMNLPTPTRCFEARHMRRFRRRNERQLYDHPCDKCGSSIQTTLSTEKPQKVFCEKCYLENVN